MAPTPLQLIGAAIFAIALVHTFSTKIFERLAHAQPAHAGLWHLLGEVEIVFGFWAMVLVLATFALEGSHEAIGYLESRNFTEPMFVFAIMVVAGTRPVLGCARGVIGALARLLPLSGGVANYWLTLALVPLLGSFITEPAAMTLAALMLRDRYFTGAVSERIKYATLGVLFVNVSIGGTLTHFAAPPVLMVASAWGWDTAHMLAHFGWRSALAVVVNATAVAMLFGRELAKLDTPAVDGQGAAAPLPVVVVHLLFLAGVVVFAHHPVVFMGLFLFFMGYTTAYARHQERLILREGLLVAFFLAGLVVLGGQQQWWLQPLLTSLSEGQVYYGATALTAITDNAALTYLGSLVEGLSDGFKYALVAGAVTGGGLTIIANAPNPAAVSILRERFGDHTVQPLSLFLAAVLPTLVAICAFRFL
ncbi:putative Na+/H+ antiporter [Derxia gummosa]|uniref:Na+/H+ antiporter n=1 Tax=Derxia gummosa DSM 723 TaxID=1121388 RepID=A0A8B6X116_9BURK|nr:putative Na+/H+ antiporter [Derxia gummosa]